MADPIAPGSALDLGAPRRIHLVGVGGAGISAIGLVLAGMGHTVTGSDVTATAAFGPLAAAGVATEVTPRPDLFAAAARHRAEVVAHSTAFPPTAAERAEAEAAGAVVVDRAAILAAICARRPTVAVSGTHGKTSTTALLATLLDGAEADPSFLVGGVPVGLGTAARWGGPDGLFVVEADESDGSFLALPADTAVVTNIDDDHLDHWGSIDRIEEAFDRFVGAARRAVVCIDDPRATGVAVDERARRVAARHGAVTVGEAPGADLRIHDVVVDRLTTTFGVEADGVELGPVRIGTPGRHHARNATAALAVARLHGTPAAAAVEALAGYRGVARRFEVVGEAAGVTVVDDYAHNPGKVRALLASAGEAGWDRVVVVFQPHRYTRTRDLGPDFGSALALADVMAVTEVYGAGEDPLPGITGRTLVSEVLDRRPWATVGWTPTLDDALAWAEATVRPGDLFLTVGAGDVFRLAPRLLDRLRQRSDG